MSDIVERLRNRYSGEATSGMHFDATDALMREAAKEIERLRGLLNEIHAIAARPESNRESVRNAMGERRDDRHR